MEAEAKRVIDQRPLFTFGEKIRVVQITRNIAIAPLA